MENTLVTGLYVSLISMAVTFVALGILIGVMYLLLKIFPDKSKGVAEVETGASIELETSKEDPKADEELAVAMAVGMALLEHQGTFDAKDPNLGKLLE